MLKEQLQVKGKETAELQNKNTCISLEEQVKEVKAVTKEAKRDGKTFSSLKRFMVSFFNIY